MESTLSKCPKQLRLEGNDRAWFAEWLIKGISCYEFGDCSPGRDPFPGAQHLIGMHEQLVDYLALIHDRLDGAQRHDFMTGIAEALRTINLNCEKDQVLASRLLSLAARLGAKEAIHVLAYSIDTDRDDPATTRLVRQLATAICAEPYSLDKRTQEALYRLSDSPAFNAILARQALPALCRADPDGLCRHLRVLHPHLQERYAPQICRENPKRSEERTRRVLEVRKLVPPAVFVSAFERWYHRIPSDDPANTIASALDWWTASMCDKSVRKSARKSVRDALRDTGLTEPVVTSGGFPVEYNASDSSEIHSRAINEDKDKDEDSNHPFPWDKEDKERGNKLLDETEERRIAA